MAKPAVETGLMAADARERELLKARIRIALSLAIENSAAQALRTLDEIESAVESHDDEITARYFQARAIARIKARDVDEGFAAFEAALGAARRHGEPLMFAKIANNHAAAAMQDGRLGSSPPPNCCIPPGSSSARPASFTNFTQRRCHDKPSRSTKNICSTPRRSASR